MTGVCPKCGGDMLHGQAIEQTCRGVGDFDACDLVVTMSPCGTGRLIACVKCRSCGHSRHYGDVAGQYEAMP